jgi:IS5 family transposase
MIWRPDMEVLMRERESNQLCFADTVVHKLGGQRTQATLDQLDASIDWQSLAKPIRKLYRNESAGAPAEPVVLMLKIMMLQKWFNLSDPQAEEQLNDRLSFRRFVGLRGEQLAPDETTMVRFRKRLRDANVEGELFAIVGRSIASKGLLLKEGTMVDALILESPRGRKTGEKDENGGETTTRDQEASFTKKHGRRYHGYKGHLAADRSGIVTGYAFSTASHHDSRYIDQLIANERKAVLADAAYADSERRRRLEKEGVLDGIIRKRMRGQGELHPLVKKINRVIASLRAEVEHTIARCRKWGLSKARYRGERRNGFDFVMGLIAHNLRRATWLTS